MAGSTNGRETGSAAAAQAAAAASPPREASEVEVLAMRLHQAMERVRALTDENARLARENGELRTKLAVYDVADADRQNAELRALHGIKLGSRLTTTPDGRWVWVQQGPPAS